MSNDFPIPPFPQSKQTPPGTSAAMTPRPDHGERSYQGHGRLAGKTALITGADSGIGRAVAIAFAREGADLVLAYLDEHDDVQETAKWVTEAGRKAICAPGDITNPRHCRALIAKTVEDLGKIDILVNNAAFQRTHTSITEITDEEWDDTMKTNLYAMFHLCKAAIPHMKPGAAIINTSSVNADTPTPSLLAYATTKGGIANFTAGLAQSVAKDGIRVNSVAPGPIWTPLIPATMPEDEVKTFGAQTPMGRPGQPAELAPAYVLLASDEASYMTGAVVPVTGGKPFL